MSQKEKVETEKTQRTSIDDLAVAGHELSEEHLQLVTGGRPPADGGRPPAGATSAGSCTSPGMSDDNPD